MTDSKREAIAKVIAPHAFDFSRGPNKARAEQRKEARTKADAILALLPAARAGEDVVERAKKIANAGVEELEYIEGVPVGKGWREKTPDEIVEFLNAASLLRAPEAPGWRPKEETVERIKKIALGGFIEKQMNAGKTELPMAEIEPVREAIADAVGMLLLSAAPSAPSVDSGVSETHEWFRPDFLEYDCCRKCGIVRRADGKNKPCKGVVYLRSMETPFTRLEYSGWLIERDCADGIEYVHTFADWTRDANKALRFNRKGDAEDTVQIFFDEVDGVRVAEHAWSDPAPSEIDRAIAEQDAFERDAETISAEVNHLPEVSSLPDRCGEDVWPLVERALVAVGRHYRTALPVADARNEGIEEAIEDIALLAVDCGACAKADRDDTDDLKRFKRLQWQAGDIYRRLKSPPAEGGK